MKILLASTILLATFANTEVHSSETKICEFDDRIKAVEWPSQINKVKVVFKYTEKDGAWEYAHQIGTNFSIKWKMDGSCSTQDYIQITNEEFIEVLGKEKFLDLGSEET